MACPLGVKGLVVFETGWIERLNRAQHAAGWSSPPATRPCHYKIEQASHKESFPRMCAREKLPLDKQSASECKGAPRKLDVAERKWLA